MAVRLTCDRRAVHASDFPGRFDVLGHRGYSTSATLTVWDRLDCARYANRHLSSCAESKAAKRSKSPFPGGSLPGWCRLGRNAGCVGMTSPTYSPDDQTRNGKATAISSITLLTIPGSAFGEGNTRHQRLDRCGCSTPGRRACDQRGLARRTALRCPRHRRRSSPRGTPTETGDLPAQVRRRAS